MLIVHTAYVYNYTIHQQHCSHFLAAATFDFLTRLLKVKLSPPTFLCVYIHFFFVLHIHCRLWGACIRRLNDAGIMKTELISLYTVLYWLTILLLCIMNNFIECILF